MTTSAITFQGTDLQRNGPLVEIALAVSSSLEERLKVDGTAVPTPRLVKALVDTGAERTVVQDGLAALLYLNPVGETNITSPSSPEPARCATYAVRLVFPRGLMLDVTAIEAPLSGDAGIQCLIGRDVLAHGVFVYVGALNAFSLSF